MKIKPGDIILVDFCNQMSIHLVKDANPVNDYYYTWWLDGQYSDGPRMIVPTEELIYIESVVRIIERA